MVRVVRVGTGGTNRATGGVNESLQMGNRSDAGAIPSSGNVSGTIPSSNAHTSSRLLQDLLESANNLPKPNNSDLGSIHLTLNGLKQKLKPAKKKELIMKDRTSPRHIIYWRRVG